MKIPITQSKAWQKLQDDLGETSVLKHEKTYHYLAIIKHTPAGNYLYCPYGPVAQDEDAFKDAISSLKELARHHHAIFIRIEPTDPSFSTYLAGQAQKTKDISPMDTWILDLTPEKATLLTNFSQGTRTRYNTYAKKGLVVQKTQDPSAIKHLVALQNKLYRAKNLSAFSEKYLRTELEQPFATLYLVKYHQPQATTAPAGNQTSSKPTPEDDQVLAASLFFDHDDTRYYMQSAADYDFRHLPATVALLTAALFDAKDQGLKQFDFWGIAPDGAPKDHPWAGFTEFKKSFGGAPRHYAGTYDIVLSPTKYRLFNSLKKARKLLHKA